MRSVDCAVARCPSVCLSHAGIVYCVEMAKTYETFSLSCCDTILVFLYQMLWQYSDRTSITGASNTEVSYFISEMIQYMAIVTYLMPNVSEMVRDTDIVTVSRDLHTCYSRVSFRMILHDLAKYSMTQNISRSVCNS